MGSPSNRCGTLGYSNPFPNDETVRALRAIGVPTLGGITVEEAQEQLKSLARAMEDSKFSGIIPAFTTPQKGNTMPVTAQTYFEKTVRNLFAGYKVDHPVARALYTRRKEFHSPLELQLTGIGMIPEARADLAKNLARVSDVIDSPYEEIIVGGGMHAAIYAATRVACGHPKPLVIEREEHTGGALACTSVPSFYLNSRNKPGEYNGLPGEMGALNYLPGATVQSNNLAMEEFQPNSDLGWIVQMTLAQYADVVTGVEVGVVSGTGSSTVVVVETDDGDWKCRRVIDARGLGKVNRLGVGKPNPRILYFPDFMKHMTSTPFPLVGMKRVAVVGGGDSGKCALEALVGLGPTRHKSVYRLDNIERIDWYGGTDLPLTCDNFRATTRSRYAALAGFLPREDFGRLDAPSKIAPVRRRLNSVSPIFEGASIGGRNYDMVVVCVGNSVSNPLPGMSIDPDTLAVNAGFCTGNEIVGRQCIEGGPFERITIGPRARIRFSEAETDRGIQAIPENVNALFRLGWRTATLASQLK
jgi:thioredoxin reductase